jgi:hypothetical protein
MWRKHKQSHHTVGDVSLYAVMLIINAFIKSVARRIWRILETRHPPKRLKKISTTQKVASKTGFYSSCILYTQNGAFPQTMHAKNASLALNETDEKATNLRMRNFPAQKARPLRPGFSPNQSPQFALGEVAVVGE